VGFSDHGNESEGIIVVTLYVPDDKWSLWKLRPISRDNIKMHMKDIRYDMQWIYVHKRTNSLWGLVITVMNLRE
jgi:hypothetical protein